MSDASQSDRYARQVQFAPFGPAGQQRIGRARVAVLGCGALGTVAAEILARAGVGAVKLIDRDVVDWSNLQRQSLFDERDAAAGHAKAAAAASRLSSINSQIQIDPEVADVTPDNIGRVLGRVDLVIDAADNFAVRLLLNDWSLSTRTPWVHGGCVGSIGQVRLFSGRGNPCFRCLVPELPPAAAVPTCETAGVIGAATHLIASLQSAEALKWLSGNREQVRDTVLSIDVWRNRIREVTIDSGASEQCRACRDAVYEYLEGHRTQGAEAVLCGRRAVQISRLSADPLDLELIAARWEGLGRVQATRFFVRLFPDDERSLTLFRDGRAVIAGTTELSEARSLYDRYVGG